MKARIALLASLVSLSLVAAASAQVSTVEGTVVSNSAGALVIDTGSGQRTFMVDAQSSLPADLAVGTRVKVEYHTLANDKFHAFKVSALGAAPTEPATAPATTATTPMGTTTTAPEPAAATPAVTAPAPAPAATMQEQTTTTTATTTTDPERRLPATASPLPLLALAGGLAVAGGALVRRLRS